MGFHKKIKIRVKEIDKEIEEIYQRAINELNQTIERINKGDNHEQN